ncbi:hypothetical protein FRC12_001334 [Ceratobasidium sp. 428]|nr:hypothetical protein FRC12_001334 [Ceratobasidium sp. 428]
MPVVTRSSGQNDGASSHSVKPAAKTLAKRRAEDAVESRPTKRVRTHASRSNVRRKRQAGNENESMMTLPIEIFMNILDYVTPCALTILVRTNKALRRILLAPSAQPIWRAAESRVPGLPLCPTWMSEPQYAALMFSNLCTICGTATTLKLDTCFFVRLCASCRKTELVKYEDVKRGPLGLANCMHLLRWSNSERNYTLRQVVDQLQEECAKHLEPGGRFGFEQWRYEKQRKICARNDFYFRLDEYLVNQEKDRQRAKDILKEQRRQLIHERLRGLGWADADFVFEGANAKPWKALVDISRPLSDKNCTTLIPKLIALLVENRTYKELQARRKQTRELLAEHERSAHAFENIQNVIGQVDPPLVVNPFPDMVAVLEWRFSKELYEPDAPIETVSTRFRESLPNLEAMLTDWRTEVELQLVENLDLERKPGDKTTLKIQGSTEPTKKLSSHTRFLLRADTIFKAPVEQTQVGQRYHPRLPEQTIHSLQYYPDLLVSPGSTRSSDAKVDISRFTRHTEAERIAKVLLADLGMPDVAYMELKAAGPGFKCGRCYFKEWVIWEDIVTHYREMNEKWEKEAKYQREQQTKHKIAFINAHALETDTGSSKPLLTFEAVRDSRISSKKIQPEVECKLCLVGWRSTTCCSIRGIAEHLENV